MVRSHRIFHGIAATTGSFGGTLAPHLDAIDHNTYNVEFAVPARILSSPLSS
jgi:hypothetical protein